MEPGGLGAGGPLSTGFHTRVLRPREALGAWGQCAFSHQGFCLPGLHRVPVPSRFQTPSWGARGVCWTPEGGGKWPETLGTKA